MSTVELTVILVWLCVLGGTIGSFLNVVVYRVPAGMSLVHPGSHCPICGHPIRWYDNVPVLGWLMLRGHCRDCGTSISMRYPLVEAVTALVFLLIAAVELGTRGANLPMRLLPVEDGTIAVVWNGIRLAGILAYHLMLFATLLPMALVEYDGKRLPWRLALPALVVGLGAPVWWPYLHPVAAGPVQSGWVGGLVDGILGLGLGLAIGLVVERAGLGGQGVAAAPALVGVVLGWQGGLVVSASAVIVHLVARGLGKAFSGLGRFPFIGWIGLGALAWILAWRPLVEVLGALRS